MKKPIAQVATDITQVLLSKLRNGQKIELSREEIRSVNFSFSQFGEDLSILNLLSTRKPSKGIYVDVGAYDPIIYSNTLLLFKHGFRGINIDIDKYKVKKFRQMRHEDYSIQAAISNSYKTVKHLRYAADATNRICDIEEINLKSALGEAPIEVQEIQTIKLTDLLDKSPFKGYEIYYLNIDCEGHDLNVLKSLELKEYSPFLISIEALDDTQFHEIQMYLEPYNYRLVGIFHVTRLFMKV